MKISCSPLGKYRDLSRYSAGGWNAYYAVHQDAQSWMQEGLMDMLFPMMYFTGNNFFPFALDWKEHSANSTVVPGLGIYFLDPKEGRWTLDIVRREMSFLRSEGLGHCFFRSKFLTDNVKGVYDFTKDFNAYPALTPPMKAVAWQNPVAPGCLKVKRGAIADELSWTAGRDRSDASYLLYNIYGSLRGSVDASDASQLIVTRFTGNRLTVSHRPNVFLQYGVTAQDRYGRESSLCKETAPKASVRILTPTDTRIPPHYDFSNIR